MIFPTHKEVKLEKIRHRFFEKKEGSDSPETVKQHYEKMFIAALC